ncbi:MAG: DNA/RNA nuclease SfsA [Brevefilum sp.]|nr:DNA/RNA nuclease SfsA [Brevefilum sp.]
MKLPYLTPATFIKRNNRFSAGVRLDGGGLASAYVPTTGRLTGVLRPGCRLWLIPADDPSRKTPYTMALAALENGGLCSTNAYLANQLFKEAVENGSLAAFKYPIIESEVSFGKSRLDFRLSAGNQACWVEVKSVTYVEDGIGRFPDAPTSRGRKHLAELANLAASGDRASVVFIAQREDAKKFAPFEVVDPAFAQTLREVHAKGVEVHAYGCHVSTESIEINQELPVDI